MAPFGRVHRDTMSMSGWSGQGKGLEERNSAVSVMGVESELRPQGAWVVTSLVEGQTRRRLIRTILTLGAATTSG